MNLEQFLTNLATEGILIHTSAGRLVVQHQNGALRPEVEALLEEFEEEILLWLAHRDEYGAGLPPLVPDPAARYEPFPLTEIQQAYWVGRSGVLALGDVGIHVYLELAQPQLDLARLNHAWQRLIAHHDMLRAVVMPDGQQRILSQVPAYQIPVIDLRALTPAAAEAHLLAARDELSHQLLPADQWPHFELRAFLLADGETRLHLSLDALCYDLSGLLRLFNQWQLLYTDLDAPLPTPALSFRDYVLAERQLETTPAYARARDYWLGRLATLPPAPALPMVKAVTALAQTRFHRRVARLAIPQWQALQHRAHAHGLTPAGVLLAAFAEVLARWSKNPTFTLNLTIYNRLPVHPQVDELIGDFTIINLLAIDQSQAAPFSARAKLIQQQLWADLEHRAFNGVRVLRELARQQGESGQVLMPVVFTSGLDIVTQNGLEPFGKTVYSSIQTPQVWFDHIVIEEAGELSFSWNTVDELFPPGLLDEMFVAYCDLLAQLAADAQLWQQAQPVQLPLAQQAQRQATNQTAAPLPDAVLPTLFQQRVAAQPDAPAVLAPTRTLTYGELSAYATTVGHWLRAHGIGVPGATPPLVAVVMEKGWEQVVAVFAIHLAGAAYLPVDPNLPTERQHYLLQQGEITLALTQSHLAAALSWPAGVQYLAVDTTPVDPTLPMLEPMQRSTDLAYVLYTSGSTGLPKGVMIEQRSVVNRMADVMQRFDLRPTDRAIALTALHHDLSVFDLFCMLTIVGGAIVLPSAEGTRDPAHWVQRMVADGVTLWNSVPAFLEMMVEYLEHAPPAVLRPTALRWVILSGDFIPVNLPDRLRKLLPDVTIISAGGPTETTVWDICYPITQVDPAWRSIPYGRPMTNAQYYVLDSHLAACPDWVPGELYIGGAGLARGYWRNEEETQARFILHPQTGQRLYRSGDLGRYIPAPAGELPTIEILGRADFQIKIRGHRIEAGEIETRLVQHPAVSQALVTATGEGQNKQLIAYIVPAATAQDMTVTNPYDADQLPAGVITDPTERIAFKLQKLGFRTPAAHEARLPLQSGQPAADHLAAYLARQSYRRYCAEPLPLAHLAALLDCLAPVQIADAPLPKYLYGSAGGLYPVQSYLYVKPQRVADLPGGLYYYHPGHRELVLLQRDLALDQTLHTANNRAIAEGAAFTLFLVGKMSAIAPLYGAWARDFCLLEAGYMSQLLMMQAPHYQLGLCPIGSVQADALLPLLQGEPDEYLLLHTLVGGAITVAQTQQLSLPEQPATQPNLLEELRHYLQSKLPDYMVPTHLMLLAALPLSANGKVERKALPLPTFEPVSTAVVAPDNALEQQLASILQELLGLDEISVTSNFFELGAHSVHMVQLYNQLLQTVAGDRKVGTFSVVDLFRYPTIRELVQHLAQPGADLGAAQREVGQERGAARRTLRQQNQTRRPKIKA